MSLDLLIRLVVIALVAWGFWIALRPRRAFVVRVAGGRPHTVQGVVTPAFLERVREVCCEHGVKSGTVRGLVRGRRISLAFTRGFPPAAQQKLRNWWILAGWPARPPERDRRAGRA